MKKKILALTVLSLGLPFALMGANANATTTDVVTKDEFVFNANDNQNDYGYSETVAQANGVTLKMGDKVTGNNVTANGFEFGDYKFDHALVAEPYISFWGFNINTGLGNPSFYLTATEGTKIGLYYTLVSSETQNNSYYVSNDSTLEVLGEKTVKNGKKKTTKYETVEVFTEELNYMYYSEFTFSNITKAALKSSNQVVCLFGVSVVTEEEISYRNEADLAIEALVNEYNLNGVSTSEYFTTLINNCKAAIENVNHLSQIDDYDSFVNINSLYEELVKVEAKIDTLVDTNARARLIRTVIKYDAESKALLDSVTESINEANELGITNDEISNYNIYLQALADYNQLEEDYNNAQAVIELINNLSDVEYTDSYLNELNSVVYAYNNLNDQSLVSNYEALEEKINLFNQLSDEAINSFVTKVNEANELKGTKESYNLINEAESLLNQLIEADKTNEEVLSAIELLNTVKAAYNDYQEEVTDVSFEFAYNEDGSIKKIYFIGTIENFVSTSDFKSITMYITNETTGEELVENISTVYKGIKISGEIVKDQYEGIRYIDIKLLNEDNKYIGNTFSMYFELEYVNGSIVTSLVSSLEVK